MNDPNYLVISSTIDYSTDLICCELERRGQNYLRINRDHFSEYQILYTLQNDSLSIKMGDYAFTVTPSRLKSVYFRAPVFLRNMGKPYTLQEQLYKSQWSSFIRNLILFDSVTWVNHPVSIYGAENKLYQLKIAQRCCFPVPETYVGNTLPKSIQPERTYIVKSLDTALFYDNGQEMFTYSTMIGGQELLNAEIRSAPIIVQEYLCDKTDIRATVIGDTIFAVSITKNGCNIEGDWRKNEKESLKYSPIDLPMSVQEQIKELMRKLGLHFGGIDLALVNGTYYFIEINPTGEWGWLVSTTKLPIDIAIAEFLVAGGVS